MTSDHEAALPDPEDVEYGLVLPFDTDNPEFRRGIEVGIMWAELQAPGGQREFQIHADCAEMAIRLGEATGLQFRADPVNNDWVVVRYV